MNLETLIIILVVLFVASLSFTCYLKYGKKVKPNTIVAFVMSISGGGLFGIAMVKLVKMFIN